jgi:hypothetical protein
MAKVPSEKLGSGTPGITRPLTAVVANFAAIVVVAVVTALAGA